MAKLEIHVIHLATIAFVLAITNAQTIRCFQCNSFTDPRCWDVLSNDTSSPLLHQCEPREGFNIFCRKTVQTIVDEVKISRVIRSCAWLRSNRSNCRKSDTDFRLETTCQCFTDGCNGAKRGVAGFAGVIIAFLLVTLN